MVPPWKVKVDVSLFFRLSSYATPIDLKASFPIIPHLPFPAKQPPSIGPDLTNFQDVF